MEEVIQAQQIAQSQALLAADENRRLRIKVGFLATGAVVGALMAPPGLVRQAPVAARLSGAMVGEMVAWVLHGLTQKRWFL